MKNTQTILALVLLSLSGCFGPDDSDSVVSIPFNTEQRLIADQTISIFENGTPHLQYDYIENIHDGRGYTAGRAGFTSATCDLLEVLTRYQAIKPGNALEVFIPRLQALCLSSDSSVAGLEQLPAAWLNAASDPVFRQMQDQVVDEYYYEPALEYAQDNGLHTALSLLVLYDSAIQHGDGEDPDGLQALITQTNQMSGGSPGDGIDERDWLDHFLSVRRNTLLHPSDPETQEAWAESVDRVDALRKILEADNEHLSPPVRIEVWGDIFELPQ